MWPCCVKPQGSLCLASPGSRMELLLVRGGNDRGISMHMSCVKPNLSQRVCRPESSLQWQWSVRGNRLELGPLTLSHAGTYTCVAKNNEGQTQKDYTLTVQGKEELDIWAKWVLTHTHKMGNFLWFLAVIFVLLSIAYHSGVWTSIWCECTHGRRTDSGVQSNWNPHTTPQLAERRSDFRAIRHPSHRVRHSHSLFTAWDLNAHTMIVTVMMMTCSTFCSFKAAEFVLQAAQESINTTP